MFLDKELERTVVKKDEQRIPSFFFFFFLRSAFLERQTPSVFSSDTEEAHCQPFQVVSMEHDGADGFSRLEARGLSCNPLGQVKLPAHTQLL